MKITVGKLRALIKEASRRDPRMSGGKVSKALDADPGDPANMKINVLKRDIASMKGRIKKKLKAGDRVNELPEMKAYLAELEQELAALQSQ